MSLQSLNILGQRLITLRKDARTTTFCSHEPESAGMHLKKGPIMLKLSVCTAVICVSIEREGIKVLLRSSCPPSQRSWGWWRSHSIVLLWPLSCVAFASLNMLTLCSRRIKWRHMGLVKAVQRQPQREMGLFMTLCVAESFPVLSLRCSDRSTDMMILSHMLAKTNFYISFLLAIKWHFWITPV